MFLGIGSTMTFLARELRNGVKAVVELDKAMTDLSIVTGMSNQQAKDTIALYNQMGRELGVSTKAVVEGADMWLRQGRSMQETNELIKVSTMFARVAQMENAEATDLLTAAMNGFKLEVKDAINIVDAMNKVDLEAA